MEDRDAKFFSSHEAGMSSEEMEEGWLRRALFAQQIDDIGSEEAAKARYDDYQQFLSVLMTVATLLMGFILTGTLLSYNYTGQLRRQDFANGFDLVTCVAVILSAASVILALLVSIRGSVIFRNRGAVQAVKAMRHSTCSIGISELSIYVSINFFFLSVLMYISWSQRGPIEICEKVRGPQADCPDLAGQFNDAAAYLCRTPQPNMSGIECDKACIAVREICEYQANSTFEERTFSLWSAGNDADALVKLGILAERHCRQDEMDGVASRLCDMTLVTPEDMTACASANVAAQHAEACVDDAVHLGALCAYVCYHSIDFEAVLSRWAIGGTAILSLLVLVRAMKILQQCAATFRHHSSQTSNAAMLGRELGLDDNFDTETEE